MNRALILFGLAGLILGTGCAGYKLGPTSGVQAGSRSVQVNFFQNDTLQPRLIEDVAGALRRHLQQDGTYRLETRGNGDIVVDGIITDYDRSTVSFQPDDLLSGRDFQIRVTVHVSATERVTGRKLIDQPVQGRTILRAGPDLASTEREMRPLLADDLARKITALLVDGTW